MKSQKEERVWIGETMNEVMLQWIMGLKLILVTAYATLYGFGGVSGKWKRRLIGSAVLTAGLFGFNIWVNGLVSWWFLSVFLLLWGATSIGYGVNSDLNKLTKNKYLTRAIVGLALALSTVSVPLVLQAINPKVWIAYGLHIIICVFVMAIFGAANPFKTARAEETAIGAATALLPMLMLS